MATANVPMKVKEYAPEVQLNQFADDLTIQVEDRSFVAAGEKIQPAIDAIMDWASSNYVELARDKSSGMVVSLDPKETAGKANHQ